MSKFKKQLQFNVQPFQQTDLVPSLFTQRQFQLLLKKSTQERLTPAEQVYFSRSVAKKLKAISLFLPLQTYFSTGEQWMIPERRRKALQLLKRLERNHKGVPILITGSFLYNKGYNDIDIFLFSKYDKEDYIKGDLHFNYLAPETRGSLFFASLTKLGIANFDLRVQAITDPPSLAEVVSYYQQVVQDIYENNLPWLKRDLRNFVLACHYASEQAVLDSRQLHSLLTILLNLKSKQQIITALFTLTLATGFPQETVRQHSQEMLSSYQELRKEHPSSIYDLLVDSFTGVVQNAT